MRKCFSWTASCITTLTSWLERCLHITRSLAATSASSTVHPRSILLMSFWMSSRHDVLGWPGFLFPWNGFQWYSLLRIRSLFIHCKWLNHLRRCVLITAVKGCTIRLQGGGGAGSFCKKKKLDTLKGKKKKTWPTHRRKKKNLTHMGRKKKTCPGQVKKKITHT